MAEVKEIRPLARVNAELQVPGSKSYTQRALVIASLADGKSMLRNALVAEDTTHLVAALRLLGAQIVSSGPDMIVTGTGGASKTPAGNSTWETTGRPCGFLSAWRPWHPATSP